MSESFKCAVIGNPIAHSLSPVIHQAFAKAEGIPLQYEKILCADENIEKTVMHFFKDEGKGLNITLPFKEKAFAMADKPMDEVSATQSANTLWMNEQNQIIADTTDGRGLIADLGQHISLNGTRVLMIGAGGAARAVIPALISQEIACLHIANRTVDKAVRLASNHARVTASSLGQIEGSFDLIINATSSSLEQKTLSIEPHLFQHAFCYDMAYQKEETAFVKQAKEAGASCAIEGLGMLVHQAALSFFDWFSVKPRVDDILKQLQT